MIRLTKTQRRLSLIGVIVAVTLGSILTVPGMFQEAEPECQLAYNWVKSHLADLPQDYDGYSAFPILYRRWIFSMLPPEKKAELWKRHMGLYLEVHPELTGRQKGVIQEGIEIVTGDMYIYPRIQAISQRGMQPKLEAYTQRARQLFSKDEFLDIFYRLGSEKPTYRSQAALKIALRGKLSRLFVVVADCNCKVSWEPSECMEPFTCVGTAPCMVFPPFSCGQWGTDACDGECRVQ